MNYEYKPSFGDRLMDNGWLFLGTIVTGIVLFTAVIGGAIIAGSIAFGEYDCGKTGDHLGVPSVYDRWQKTCYITVDGHQIDARKYIVNQQVQP